MTPRGKLIAIEGIDGSGKNTQMRLLEQDLTSRGFAVYSTGFPQYESWFGRMVGQFLNGDLGPLDKVDPHFSALLYAGDRFEAKSKIVTSLSRGAIVLADRYVASNLAHQTARVPAEKRADFLTWIEYLRVPPNEAQILVKKKPSRSYTDSTHDILEANIRHLEEAAGMYDSLSRQTPWATIQCYDAMRKMMRPPEEISADVITAVRPLLPDGGRR